MMFKDSNSNQFDKAIATQKPNKVKVNDVATAAAVTAKSNTRKLCDCPGSEPGKINLDVSAHLPGCWIRKKLLSGGLLILLSHQKNRRTAIHWELQ
jgi:hypothetical protein